MQLTKTGMKYLESGIHGRGIQNPALSWIPSHGGWGERFSSCGRDTKLSSCAVPFLAACTVFYAVQCGNDFESVNETLEYERWFKWMLLSIAFLSFPNNSQSLRTDFVNLKINSNLRNLSLVLTASLTLHRQGTGHTLLKSISMEGLWVGLF